MNERGQKPQTFSLWAQQRLKNKQKKAQSTKLHNPLLQQRKDQSKTPHYQETAQTAKQSGTEVPHGFT